MSGSGLAGNCKRHSCACFGRGPATQPGRVDEFSEVYPEVTASNWGKLRDPVIFSYGRGPSKLIKMGRWMPSGSGCSGVCCDLTSPGLHINDDNDGEFRGNHTKVFFVFKFLDLEAPQPQLWTFMSRTWHIFFQWLIILIASCMRFATAPANWFVATEYKEHVSLTHAHKHAHMHFYILPCMRLFYTLYFIFSCLYQYILIIIYHLWHLPSWASSSSRISPGLGGNDPNKGTAYAGFRDFRGRRISPAPI